MANIPDRVRDRSEAYSRTLTARFTKHTRQAYSDSAHAQTYQYRPLRDPKAWIRLLYLPPNPCFNGSKEGMLQCELMTFRKDKAPRYAALSYAWGDTSLCRQIAVGGKTRRITNNLAVALEHLQERHNAVILWVDAICIDQQNTAEKSAQVQMMGDIFMSASVVLVWLGPSNDESNMILRWIKESSFKSNTLERASIAEIRALVPLGPVRVFLDRPWFSRVWVMQEVALNQEVIFVCGAKDVGKNQFLLAVVFASVALSLVAEEFRPPHFGRFATRQPLPLVQYTKSNLSKIGLWHAKFLHSSEPRDFVFSLLGMISDAERYQLKADYSKTVEEIYTDFAAALVETGGLRNLSLLWAPSSKYPELPSWVPDWSATSAIFPHASYTIPGTSAKVHLTNEGNRVLRIYALRIDKIKSVEDGHPGDDLHSVISQEDLCQFLNKLGIALSCFPDIYDPGEIDRIVYEMSIASSQMRWYKACAKKEKLYNSYLALRGLVQVPKNIEDMAPLPAETSDQYVFELQHSDQNRHIFTTSHGIVGLTGHKIQGGDLLFLLHGSTGFWILREIEPSRYRIISSASARGYTHLTDNDDMVELIDIY